MKVAYIRVSTLEQNEQRQVEALEKYGIEKWFIEKISGKDKNRPKLMEMLDFIRDKDEVYVWEFSRLGRSTCDLLDIVKQIEDKGAKFNSVKEGFDTSTPAGRLQMTMLAAIAQFEREMILERQREGIAIAKKEGKYMGRQVKEIDEEVFQKVYDMYTSRKINKVQMAKELNISRPTLDKILKDKGLK